MKNPFYINFLWLGIVILVLSGLLFFSCFCNQYYFLFKPRTENILLGILSSALLLLFVEILNWIIDRKKYGYLHGKYKKTLITQVNPNGQRSSEIPEAEKKESDRKIKFIKDSIYHRLDYYEFNTIEYRTYLEYQYHGIYIGYVEYYDHKNGNWKNNSFAKIKAKITISLNLANRMTGFGSYKYSNIDDFGKYEIHVDDDNSNRIIVHYKNTIPSGLSEGYEVWESI
jgi:hypothetical protein